MSKTEEDMVGLALTELENAMDALHKINRETDIVDDVEYNKINRAIWDIEQILKDWQDENESKNTTTLEEWNQGFRR
tara:strand:+ start:243 stop:473 length:231 start_codon:yes stop_codon:yes gene_type:complete